MKNVIIKFIKGEITSKASARPGENLLEICRQNGIFLEAACNGNGTCGKCRVQIVRGKAPAAEEERRFFSEKETALGYRLACRVKAAEDLEVCVQENEADRIQMPGLGITNDSAQDGRKDNTARSGMDCRDEAAQAGIGCRDDVAQTGMDCRKDDNAAQAEMDCVKYDIALDIGSTTLAAVLLQADGTVLAQASAVNSQRYYGADVISRIQASNESERRREELRSCICKDAARLFQTLLAGRTAVVSRIAIAGNTAMLHLLRGYSCAKLGRAPFEPVNLELECLAYETLFPEVSGCKNSRVYLLPGLSAFIGADITAGLYSSGFYKTQENELSLFLDLGTNGELAAGNRAGFVTASTAAGPAFEGGGLSCGCPGISGAISNVSYLYHRVRIQTIGQKKPCGICGTGALAAAAALLKEGLMDADGLLAPELFERGMLLAACEDGREIRLTQADIREIQMAKAAVRAGMETLLLRYQEQFGKPSQMPGSIYLAGGFGYYLSADTAAAVGLFPAEWTGKIVSCGNTSLKGAIAFLSDPSCAGVLEDIRRKNREIQLAEDKHFQEIYIQAMRFA